MKTQKILLVVVLIFIYVLIGYIFRELKHMIQQDIPTIAKTTLIFLSIVPIFLGVGITICVYKLWKLLTKREYHMVTFEKDMNELNTLLDEALSKGDGNKTSKIQERIKDYLTWVQSHIDITKKINKMYSVPGASTEVLTFPPPEEYSLSEFD